MDDSTSRTDAGRPGPETPFSGWAKHFFELKFPTLARSNVRQLKDAEWSPNTRAQADITLDFWIQLAGDKRIGEYGRADAVRFKSQIGRLPSMNGRSIYSKGTVEERIRLADLIELDATHEALEEAAGRALDPSILKLRSILSRGCARVRRTAICVSASKSSIMPMN